MADIIADYEEDGDILIRHLEDACEAEAAQVGDRMAKIKRRVSTEIMQTLKRLKAEAADVEGNSILRHGHMHMEKTKSLLATIKTAVESAGD